jgi:hypothetical protein
VNKLWKLHRGRARFRAAGDEHEPRLNLPELEAAVRSVEPSARLVPPRVLRRVIRVHCSLGGFGFRVPHSKTYVIPSAALSEIADRDELGMTPTESLPPIVILLERPSAEEFEERSRGELLLRYWELLFHARVHCEFDSRRPAEQMSRLRESSDAFAERMSTMFADRVTAIGSEAFDEIREVLHEERFLLPRPASGCPDDASVYVEFAAVYLGMRYFKPFLLCSFFPALPSFDAIDQIIAQDVDAITLLDATRLPGTPEPDELRDAARRAAEAFDADPLAEITEHPDDEGATPAPHRIPAGRRSMAKYQNWSERAVRHSVRGNLAGAIARRARAEAWAPREKAAIAATALREEVNQLVARLQTALEIDDDDPRPWRESLLAIAHQVPRGLWTVEARLLYDLQRACIDQERPTSTVDVMHWILSFGRRAIRRDLPDQRRVAMSRHLRSAEHRLASVRISDKQRRQLAAVLGAAARSAEDRLREDLRPKIAAALDEIDLRPKNLPERVSRRKIVEELLDRIVERGFLTLGEVRDAISRNQVKEPDCSGPRSFIRGEAALRADRRLTDALDGVYEPGDFYMRWILRFSHLMFGTAIGRWITRYVVLPFGGAVVTLIVVEHLASWVTHREEFYAPTWSDPVSYGPMFLVGAFLFGLIHVKRFRRINWEMLLALGRGIKLVFYDVPRQFFELPWVKTIVRSKTARIVLNVLLKPALPTLIVARFVPAGASWQKIVGLASMYVGLVLFVNSRVGRNLEEMAFDSVSEGWQRFGVRPLVGLFWFTVDIFRRMMQGIERVLYTVDEWLRFRSGQSRAMLILKGALGVIWFYVAYAVRFIVTLLIEPQINPVKHVPWVTVSHKIMAPIWIAMDLRGKLAQHMSHASADVVTALIVFLTPGIFGFLIWELKENWRLFAANRDKTLDPVLIGSHGETMTRLLRPGIHSGTIPKRFAKLRRAERKALGGADPGAARKHREALHHVEIYLRRYIEREFLAWFEEKAIWTEQTAKVGEVYLTTSEAAIEVEVSGWASESFTESTRNSVTHLAETSACHLAETSATPLGTCARPATAPVLLKFRLLNNAVQLELSGQLCMDDGPIACREVFRLTLINVLKTASAVKLVRCDETSSAEVVTVEVGSLVVPWADWVAAWENEKDTGQIAAWNVIPLR